MYFLLHRLQNDVILPFVVHAVGQKGTWRPRKVTSVDEPRTSLEVASQTLFPVRLTVKQLPSASQFWFSSFLFGIKREGAVGKGSLECPLVNRKGPLPAGQAHYNIVECQGK